MRINVCVNGTFRYPQYIRHYAESGMLGKFFFSHKISSTASSLGIAPAQHVNIWFKEYLLHAGLRLLRPRAEQDFMVALGDMWQSAVLSRWEACDTVEAVIGQIADRVIRHAKREGSRIIGHPVNSHPVQYASLLNEENELLGLKGPVLHVSGRRLAEIEDCDHIVVDSQFVARSFAEQGYSKDKISVVPPSADARRFSPRAPSEIARDVFTIISVGAVSPRKGHRYLLEAWRRLKLKGARLIIVGASSRATPEIFRGFEGEFTHYEHVPNAALRPLLASSSAFVLTSIEDGYAQAVAEALNCGVPAIVSSNMGSADLISPGRNGFVLEPRDVDGIASAIQTLYDQRDLAEEMGETAARMMNHSIDWSGYVGQMLCVHKAVNNVRRGSQAISHD